MEPHQKIIRQVAKKILQPEGLFQKGTSRLWLDDNDYFMTLVEFQPHSYEKGCFLNVGVCFLWGHGRVMEDGPDTFDIGGRVEPAGLSYVPYDGQDDVFAEKTETLTRRALEEVVEYRRLRDLTYAKERLVGGIPAESPFGEVYDAAMLCFFKGDYEDGMSCLQRFLEILDRSLAESSVPIPWKEALYRFCREELLFGLSSAQAAQRMVCDSINRCRASFGAKPSLQKMKKNVVF